jgi:hypothetical protein
MTNAPDTTSPSAVALRIFALLRPLTPFGDAIVKRQAERAGLDLTKLSEGDLATLAPMILKAAAVFVDPMGITALKREFRL